MLVARNLRLYNKCLIFVVVLGLKIEELQFGGLFMPKENLRVLDRRDTRFHIQCYI